ncbi:hypothetical protein COY25_01495 [Candidatus Uhrbacteria bacterium CG_4_10_14_0_2_um_filter_41_7]|uniref:Uncharacterized protein n=1 Tax=Candidatus Uhrbacteria bacterium CG_4_9_14_3_um_filter_41_35 TaxID=1975034 RepID=A0A2M7XEP1_9BACT|nr:MAG: hypothetical protein COV92_00700 [Candidatus Uhrbacteria bacterium CG11_big_fil_rev_8_21_14_0_20_41_9]PIZ54959.1 MAG: hypothetical protein COY25_01495 [Candidatus Uhrbacteria bacterium CG_4_10_14_0_2_um_filter_41_7]PJA46322.1 MAG: hypothetical protein CO173_03105 [Candidatus Uhrbacteria bacterium CG_4_9_14_3_um_filter_41_35]
MPHPHQSFLDEFKIAISHMVPLTPPEIIVEANQLHDELLADEEASEKKIHQAMSIIGRKEYPYRKAFEELCAGDEEQRLQEAVFERLDEDVKKKVMEMTSHGVILEDYVASPLFEEQLEGDERFQVEQAIMLADEVLDNQCDDRAHKRKIAYEDLVKKHTDDANRLQGLIDRLREMAIEDPKWAGEIEGTASRLEEGWAITEKDPSEEEILKEIEYWNTVLHEEGETGDIGDMDEE